MTIQEIRENLKGSIVALVTPMKNEGEEIDYKALKKLFEWHITEGTHAVLIGGTTGESPTLRNEEFEKIMEKSAEFAQNKIKIICGSGTNSTYESIRKTKLAIKYKMDAALLITPYYNCPTQEGLYEHFKKVAEECSSMPIILYNVPKRTGRDLLPETVARLSKINNIIGIKEASGNLERVNELLKISPNFKIFSGDDGISCEAILSGCAGVISVTSNVLPKQMSNMCTAALNKQANEARKINSSIECMHEKLFVEANPIPVKWLLNNMNFIQGCIRLPLTPLSSKFHEELKNTYKQCSQ